MKKILLILIFFSFSFSFNLHIPGNNVEYSVGINDKTGLFGLCSKSWITDKSYGESYITAGSLIVIGSLGYGKKYYLSKNSFLPSFFHEIKPYVSWTGFGYYILPMSESGNPFVSLGFSVILGVDFITIEWKKNKLKFQFGLLSSYDPLRDKNLIISGEGGPSFLMPSVNIQLRFQR